MSGGERNRLFTQREGNFVDVSTVSNLDFREDGRGFALTDFDKDGWLDLVVMSPQHPRIRIIKNRLGQSASDDNIGPSNSAYIRLVGGQSPENANDPSWSAVDAVGAELLVRIGDLKRMYQVSFGEGLSVQNSRWIHIGMGSHSQIDQIRIRWPNGRKSEISNISAGQWINVHEGESATKGD